MLSPVHLQVGVVDQLNSVILSSGLAELHLMQTQLLVCQALVMERRVVGPVGHVATHALALVLQRTLYYILHSFELRLVSDLIEFRFLDFAASHSHVVVQTNQAFLR